MQNKLDFHALIYRFEERLPDWMTRSSRFSIRIPKKTLAKGKGVEWGIMGTNSSVVPQIHNKSPAVPATTAVPAAAKHQQHNHNNEKSGGIHVRLLMAVRFAFSRAPRDTLRLASNVQTMTFVPSYGHALRPSSLNRQKSVQ
jgi:hypothetical protein